MSAFRRFVIFTHDHCDIVRAKCLGAALGCAPFPSREVVAIVEEHLTLDRREARNLSPSTPYLILVGRTQAHLKREPAAPR